MWRALFILAILLAPNAGWCATLRVVTTTPTLASLVRSVGGDVVDVESICASDQDPHFIRARPSYMRLLAGADLFVRIGLELEKSWESPLVRGSRNTRVQPGQPGHLDVSLDVQKLGVPTGLLDRSMGDIHALGNPHIWLDPHNGRLIAHAIMKRLGTLAPKNEDYFESRLADFEGRLDRHMFGNELVERVGGDTLWRLDNRGDLSDYLEREKVAAQVGGWRALSAQLAQTPIVTFHRSWTYLADRFRIPVVAQLEPKPGIHPSPSHLLQVMKLAGKRGVKLIVLEPYYERKVADFVSGKTGVPVAVVPNASGAETGLSDYLSMLDNAIRQIVDHAPGT